MHQRSLMSLHLCSKIKMLEGRRNQCQGFNCNVLLYFLLCCFGGQEYNEYRMIHNAGEELKYHHPKCDSFHKNFYCLFVGGQKGTVVNYQRISHHLHQIKCTYLSDTVLLTLFSLSQKKAGWWLNPQPNVQPLFPGIGLQVCPNFVYGLLSQKVLEYIDRGRLIDWISMYAAMENHYPC